KYTVTQRRRNGLPVWTYQEPSQRPFHRCYSASGLGISRRDPVPDAPNVFPAFPSNSVEKRKLQVVSLVPFPAVRDVDHVPRFQPFVPVNHRSEWVLILTPCHHVPGQCFVGWPTLRFKSKRVPDFVCRKRERQWHSILCVA